MKGGERPPAARRTPRPPPAALPRNSSEARICARTSEEHLVVGADVAGDTFGAQPDLQGDRAAGSAGRERIQEELGGGIGAASERVLVEGGDEGAVRPADVLELFVRVENDRFDLLIHRAAPQQIDEQSDADRIGGSSQQSPVEAVHEGGATLGRSRIASAISVRVMVPARSGTVHAASSFLVGSRPTAKLYVSAT